MHHPTTPSPSDQSPLRTAYRLLDEAVEAGTIPGAVALVATASGWLPPYATGLAVDTPEARIPATPATIYDLASLTKVVATLPLVLLLVGEGAGELDSPAAAVLTEWREDPAKARVTLRSLLAHTSGLPNWRDLHSHGWTPEEIVGWVLAEPLEAKPGERYAYSDLGYILLGVWAERVAGAPLDELVRRRVLAPLGLAETLYLPTESLRPRLAAGEWRDALGRWQWGEVNDDNARALGAAAGHAGLFAPAADLARYLDALWLPWRRSGPSHVPPDLAAEALRDQTGRIPEARRGLGWTLRGDTWDPTGERMSARSFGHTGYTGTSLWIDPELQVAVILLANRVHRPGGPSVVPLRSRFHDAIANAVGGR